LSNGVSNADPVSQWAWRDGPPVVRREELPKSAPRAITEEEQRRLLRLAERARARDRAIVVLLLYPACGWRSLSRSTSMT